MVRHTLRIVLYGFLSGFIYIQAARSDIRGPEMWGISMAVRTVTLPYKEEMDTAYDIVPMMFYQKNRFFLKGLSAGYTLYRKKDTQLNVLARYRFCDIPSEYEDKIKEDPLNIGPQFVYWTVPHNYTKIELLMERYGRFHINAISGFDYWEKNWEVSPFIKLRWKNDKFNNTYYGLETATPGSAFDVTVGSDIRYRIYDNLYIFGLVTLTMLDSDTLKTEVIDNRYQSATLLGIGIFNDRKTPIHTMLTSKPYIRIAYGRATPTDILYILAGQSEQDIYHNQIYSIFYGIPVSDKLFTLPVSIYFTPGCAYHQKSDVQPSFPEYVAAVKLYYTLNLPVLLRIGFAEGISYATQIAYIEQTNLEDSGYEPSKLLNYLDVSFDVNPHKILPTVWLENLWMGYSIHHRSGIYKSSSLFGRVKGGSNYNTLYLQYHF